MNQTKSLTPNQVDFTVKDHYLIRLSKDEIAGLSEMLFVCLKASAEGDYQLELLVIEEIRGILKRKHVVCISSCRVKLLPSQANVLFLWMNQAEFAHPLYNNLAGRLVDQIYRQLL